MAHCKLCNSTKSIAWAQSNPVAKAAIDHQGYVRHRDKRVAWQRSNYLANSDERKAYSKKWSQLNKDRFVVAKRARAAVQRELKTGRMTRPSMCSECGQASPNIEGAHSDYAQPLLVRWLCRPCHRRWDSEQPKTQPVIAGDEQRWLYQCGKVKP